MKSTENACDIRDINVGDLIQLKFKHGRTMRYLIIDQPEFIPIGVPARNHLEWKAIVLTVHPADYPKNWIPGSIIRLSRLWIQTYAKKVE
jgi:hypothetical protein